MDLPGAIALLPTPLTTDAPGPGAHGDGGMDLRTTVRRHHGTQEWDKYEPAIRRWEGIVGREAPVPTEPNITNGNPRLASRFNEWMMGWDEGWVTDLIEPSRRKIEGTVSHSAAMRMIGNGVCTRQAAQALRDLLDIDA